MVASEIASVRVGEGEPMTIEQHQTIDHLGILQSLALKEPVQVADGEVGGCIYCGSKTESEGLRVASYGDDVARLIDHEKDCPWDQLPMVYAHIRVLQAALAIYAEEENWSYGEWDGPGSTGGIARYVLGIETDATDYLQENVVKALVKELDRKSQDDIDRFFLLAE